MCEGEKLLDKIALKLGCRVREKSCSEIKNVPPQQLEVFPENFKVR